MSQFSENESISDALLKHSIYLKYLIPEIGAAQISIVDQNNTQLRGEILEFYDKNKDYRFTKKQQKLTEAFRKRVAKLRGGSIREAYNQFIIDMIALAMLEQGYTKDAVKFYSDIALEADTEPAIERMVLFMPILGSTIEQIYKDLAIKDTDRIVDTVVNGIQANDTRTKIEGDVFNKGGVLEVTRNFINNRNRDSGSTRTIMTGVLGESNTSLFKKNLDQIKRVIYIAILDSATSEICRSRSRNVYPIELAPQLPAHRNCRTHYEPYIEGENEDIENYGQWFGDQDKTFQRFVLG
ncbi:unnamed protein product, partial [marine sediment metagenome]